MSALVGRNAPCPCGSGKKHKRCCALKARKGIGARSWILITAIAAMLLTGAIAALSSLDDIGDGRGPARVWSEEHGHWH